MPTRTPIFVVAASAAALLGAAAVWWARAPVASQDSVGGQAAALTVPSGQPVTFLDRNQEEGGVVRFRFLAPQIAENSDPAQATADMQALCDGFALAQLPKNAAPPAQIIISLSAREVPLGEIAPDVVQFFDAYRVENGSCVWEMF